MTRKSLIRIVLVLAVVALTSIMPSPTAIVKAQTVELAPYTIAPYPHPDPRKGCDYFAWNNVTGSPRADFYHYAMPGAASGETAEENPLLTDITVVIDGNAAAPTAQNIGRGDRNQELWRVALSEAAYKKDSACLPTPSSK